MLRPQAGEADRGKVACLDALEGNVQQLLKQEWDKYKIEARTGQLQDAAPLS